MEVKWADRIEQLPPYLFAEIDAKRDEMRSKGVDIIDLGIGDPDIPTPQHIIEALKEAAQDPSTHRYPSYVGLRSFRESVADWYKQRFDVEADPGSEIVTLIGSKEGIAHTPLAFINPGDVALVTDPGYPVYKVSTTFAGGVPYPMPLRKENDFLPDLSAVPKDIRKKAKIMFINYPNNPTTAVSDQSFFEDVVDFARENDILVLHDAAYTEISFDGFNPPSLLQVEGAKEVGMEFHSLSKTFSMTGWRIGFAVGNKKAVSGLGKIKTNIDSGVFEAVQRAGVAALENYERGLEERVATYRKRRDIFCKGLDELGLRYDKPKATFYVWFEVPDGTTSKQFASRLLEEIGIVVTPGNGFGEAGEGFARVSTTIPTERLEEAVERIRDADY